MVILSFSRGGFRNFAREVPSLIILHGSREYTFLFRRSLDLQSLQMMLSRRVVPLTLKRTYVSAAFSCKESWDERLGASIFKSLEINKFYFDIDKKFQRESRGSPIDTDIFANAILSPAKPGKPLSAVDIKDRLDQLEDILKKFRRTPQTNMSLDSMSHAVVRAFVDSGNELGLMRVLRDREAYGIFPDDYSLVYMLDTFIESGKLREATKVAIGQMLQEEFDVPIASQMSLYSAFKYAMSLPDINEEDESQMWEPQLPSDAKVKKKEAEDDEEVKVRVWFADNNYFDDHFDLTERHHLVGKTLAKFAEHGMKNNSGNKDFNEIRFSLRLLGYSLYQQWDDLLEVLEEKRDVKISKDCLDLIQNYVVNLPDKTKGDSGNKEGALAALTTLETVQLDILDHLKDEILKAVDQNEQKFIDDQLRLYKKWIDDREQGLKDQYELYLKESRLQSLEEKKKEIAKQEEKLFFFDNYSDMEKKKTQKFIKWRSTWPPKTGIRMPPKEEVKEDYVPPQVIRRKTEE